MYRLDTMIYGTDMTRYNEIWFRTN